MTLYDLAGGKHTFAKFGGQGEARVPKTVLDLGTGLGLWPVAQAAIWPETKFIGLDSTPCQINLEALATAELTCRREAKVGSWCDVRDRVRWERGDVLEPLAFDTGSFDMVHIRMIGLGVPETKWGDVLEEAVRVLKRGGLLEIVETSYQLPTSSPSSLIHSYSSLLLSLYIHPIPSLPINFALSLTQSLVSKPSFDQAWNANDAPGALVGAVMTWVRSALGGRGTALVRNGGDKDVADRMGRELCKWRRVDRCRQSQGVTSSTEHGEKAVEQARESEVTVWAWVGKKQ